MLHPFRGQPVRLAPERQLHLGLRILARLGLQRFVGLEILGRLGRVANRGEQQARDEHGGMDHGATSWRGRER